MANNMKAILLVLTILPVFMIVIPSEGIAFAQIVSQDDNQGNDDCESLLGELSFMSLDAFLEDCNYQGNDDQGNDDDDQGSNNNDDDDDDQGSNNNDDDDDDQGNDDDDQGSNNNDDDDDDDQGSNNNDDDDD